MTQGRWFPTPPCGIVAALRRLCLLVPLCSAAASAARCIRRRRRSPPQWLTDACSTNRAIEDHVYLVVCSLLLTRAKPWLLHDSGGIRKRPYSFAGRRKWRPRTLNKMYAGADLSSRDPAVQVLWALMSLTSVFGMGTGVSSPSLAPAHLYSTPFGLYYLGYLFFLPRFSFSFCLW